MVRLAKGSAETARLMMSVSSQSVIGIFVKHLRSRRGSLGRPGLAGDVRKLQCCIAVLNCCNAAKEV